MKKNATQKKALLVDERPDHQPSAVVPGPPSAAASPAAGDANRTSPARATPTSSAAQGKARSYSVRIGRRRVMTSLL